MLLVSVFGPYAQDDQTAAGHQPDGAVSQPGDARATRLLVSHVSSILGIDAHPGESEGPLHAARLSLGGAVRRGNQDAAIRRDRDHVDHAQPAQGAADVPADPQASAARDDRRRRAYRQLPRVEATRSTPTTSSRAKAFAGCGPFSAKTRIGRSGIRRCRGEYRPAHHGRDLARPSGRRCATLDSLRRMSDGLQLLLDLGHVRRQGKMHRVLQDRRRTVRNHVSRWSELCTSQSFFVMDENFLLDKRGRSNCSS